MGVLLSLDDHQANAEGVFHRDSRGAASWTRTSDPVTFTLSSDGERLVFIGGRQRDRQIYMRSMSDRSIQPIAGTEGAEAQSLFLSPNGEWVGFYRDEKLWKTRVEGGIPVALLASPAEVWYPRWWEDNTITFSRSFSSGLFQVSADRGEPRPLTELVAANGELAHMNGVMLPKTSNGSR